MLLYLPVLTLLRAHKLHFQGFDGLFKDLCALFKHLKVVAREIKVLCILSCEAQCEKDFIRRAWQRKNYLSNLGDGGSYRSELGLGWVLGDITGKFAKKFDGS